MENKNQQAPADYHELLIGCGSARDKRVYLNNMPETFQDLTTLDYNADHKPDFVFDLHAAFYTGESLPFADNYFDEIHAYEVLEHLGSMGDYRFFFHEFTEYARILKPGGYFCATVPSPQSPWALGDPSHTRLFHPFWLTFLSQAEYEKQVGKTAMSDFRYLYKADFERVAEEFADDGDTFVFVLQKKGE
jgi:SAM-dependent methyltransferase